MVQSSEEGVANGYEGMLNRPHAEALASSRRAAYALQRGDEARQFLHVL